MENVANARSVRCVTADGGFAMGLDRRGLSGGAWTVSEGFDYD